MLRPLAMAAVLALVAAFPGCSTGSLDGLGNQLFSAPVEDVHAAAKVALERLSVTVDKDQRTDTGRWVYAHTPGRSITVQVVRIEPSSTRLSIVANGTMGPQDRATAAAIIAQTKEALDARLAAEPARTAKRNVR